MKATIECQKCGAVGKLEAVYKFMESPKGVIALYLPNGWRAMREEPYCKKCSNIIFKEMNKLFE